MNIVIKRLEESIQTKQRIAGDTPLQETIIRAASLITKRLNAGNSVYFCGNGGSAADAQHLAAELSGKFYIDRAPLPAEALHCNTSFLTAVANDYSFDAVYARLISGIGKKGDVLIGLSTSGNSGNVVKAFEKAKELGIHTVALTGEKGGQMKEMAEMCIAVPSDDTPRIQESHITIGHIICEVVEDSIFGKTNK
jgi:Phosphoheptose isomerase